MKNGNYQKIENIRVKTAANKGFVQVGLIEIDMPLLCFGELKKDYPKKRLPDFEVFDKISDLKNNKDAVLDFAIKMCKKK